MRFENGGVRKRSRLGMGLGGGWTIGGTYATVPTESVLGFAMNSVRQVVAGVAITLLVGTAHGTKDATGSLNDAVEQGRVAIESVTGSGGSSGTVLNGVVVNATPLAQRILVHLHAPLFFRNRGAAQNMVATQVYGRDGSYWQQTDGKPYIEVAAGSRLPVTFVAYCVDFDKDNPSAADTFDVIPVPQAVEKVMQQITVYETANRDDDTTRASQLALWVAQGHSLATIGEKFGFDANDTMIMTAILATPLE